MAAKVPARDQLWEIAAGQHGYVTSQQAEDLGITNRALNQLAFRETLEHPAFGVYRFPNYPVMPADPYMLAVLWTRAPEAALSHETALDVFGVSDVNPSVIHVTVGKHRRIRRADGDQYEIHYEDLAPTQITWWEEVPVVTLATAIMQCISAGTPLYLLRQAITNGHAQGRLTERERAGLTELLELGRD